ncbi:alpha/beta family hydrolase [Arhodomonas sp. SL1]|uniref:alpha/beta family hydrolase n=1 Tax=Arhodomonas sp. SL1 TaxID=3425691 RepID=UPI003F88208A
MTDTMAGDGHWLVDGPARASVSVVLAHGAGAPMDSPFMGRIAEGLAAAGHRVVRFEFPYMQRRRVDGRRRGPDRQAVLLGAFRDMVAAVRRRWPGPVVIGGKSMGGRMASLVADELGVTALVVFGFPFHPPGRPERLRTTHLMGLHTPALILQGERDPFGRRDEVEGYGLPAGIVLEWLPDGDHSFVPRRRSGESESANLERGVAATDAFLRRWAAVTYQPRP